MDSDRFSLRHVFRGGYVELALALSASFVLISYSFSIFDVYRGVSNANGVYRLEARLGTPGAPTGWIGTTPLPFKDNWSQLGFPIESSARFVPAALSVRADGALTRLQVGFVDNELPEIFALPVLRGDIKQALAGDAIALSARTAKLLFPTSEALGRQLRVAGETLVVRAVYEDIVATSVIHADALAGIRSPIFPDKWRLEYWLEQSGQNFVKLYPGANSEELAYRANKFFETTPAFKALPPEIARASQRLWEGRLTALPELALSGAGSDQVRRVYSTLILACTLLIVFAFSNLLNASAVEALERRSELATRRTVGARTKDIFAQFARESLPRAYVAAVLGAALVACFASLLEDVLNRPIIRVGELTSTLAILFALASLLGIAMAIYPTVLAARLRPLNVISVRGNFESPFGMFFRGLLATVQFVGAILLLAYLYAVDAQVDFLGNRATGYDSNGVLAVDAPVSAKDHRLIDLSQLLATRPEVTQVSLSLDVPGRNREPGSTYVRIASGSLVLLSVAPVSPTFFATYRISPLAGRVFDAGRDKQGSKESVVINELAVSALGFRSPDEAVGKRIYLRDGSASEVIGVIPDINLRGPREENRPTLFGIGSRSIQVMSVRTMDTSRTALELKALWAKYFPDDVLTWSLVAKILDDRFADERRLARSIAVGATVALGMAMFCIFSLARFLVQRRLPESALRRVLGASRTEIATRMLLELFSILAVALVVAIPLSYYLVETYLSTFPNRAALGFRPQLFAVAVMVATSFVASAFVVHKASSVPTVALLRAS